MRTGGSRPGIPHTASPQGSWSWTQMRLDSRLRKQTESTVKEAGKLSSGFSCSARAKEKTRVPAPYRGGPRKQARLLAELWWGWAPRLGIGKKRVSPAVAAKASAPIWLPCWVGVDSILSQEEGLREASVVPHATCLTLNKIIIFGHSWRLNQMSRN